MKKNYFIVLMLAISSLAMAQTVNIVKDYYPADNEWGGLVPTKLISNSSMIVFSGVQAAAYRFGWNYFNEPFVTDGTSDNFSIIDVNPGEEPGQQSYPGKYFVVNDVIHFVGSVDRVAAIYKVTDVNGNFELVTDAWTPIIRPEKIPGDEPLVVFPGKNPADATDENYYLLQWDGNAGTTPSVTENHLGEYYMNPTKGFASMYEFGIKIYIMCAKDPNNTEIAKNQVCVIFYSNSREDYVTTFTKINPDVTVDDAPENFTCVADAFYFNDTQGQIWKATPLADGGVAELVTAVSNAVNTDGNTTKVMGCYNENLVFYAQPKGSTTTSVFIYNHDSEIVTELNPGFEIRNPGSLVELGGKMYFKGQHCSIPYDYSQNADPLWCYDEFTSTLSQVTTDLDAVDELHVFGGQLGGKLYFSAIDPDFIDNGDGTFGSTHRELFVFDPNGTPTAIERVFNNHSIKISPNPSNGYVNVSGLETTNASYEIYNLAGTEVEAGVIINGQINYNVQPGVYILQITDGATVNTHKIMVK